MQRDNRKQAFCFLLLLLLVPTLLTACKEPKEARLAVTDQEFFVRRVSEWGFEVAAKGRVKNIGEVDARRVMVAGYCPSCPESQSWENWFISNIDKTEEEQAVISYLVPGAEQEFEFNGVAMYMSRSGKAPESMPEQMEIKVVSHEAVN